jgi:hypothetical protein
VDRLSKDDVKVGLEAERKLVYAKEDHCRFNENPDESIFVESLNYQEHTSHRPL